MLLQISLVLVLTYCVAANGGANHENEIDASYGGTGSNDFAVDKYTGNLGNGRTDTNYRKHNLQKRALSSFLQAWKRILATTLGSKRYIYSDNTKAKMFFKKGTADDAFTDFYSLRPTRTWQSPTDGSLLGISGNQVFELKSAKGNTHPILFLLNGKNARELFGIPSPNKIERSIVYFDKLSAEEAKDMLGVLDMLR